MSSRIKHTKLNEFQVVLKWERITFYISKPDLITNLLSATTPPPKKNHKGAVEFAQ